MQSKTRFTVKSAVFSIVALAAVVMAALIGIGVYSQNLQEALHEEVKRDEKLTLLFDRLEIEFLQARRAEKDFLLRRDEKYAGRHAGIMDRMGASLAEAEALMRHGSRLSVADMDAFEAALQEYRIAFAALAGSHRTLGFDENSGLQGQLRAAVHEIETSLKELDQPEMQVKMLMMRRHEKDFILRGAPKYLGRLEERVAEFRAFPDSYYADSAQQKAILEKLEAYQSSFTAYVKEVLAEAELRKTMSQKFAEAEPILTGLRHAAMEDLEALNAASEAAGHTAKRQSLIAGLGGMVLFVLIALRLAFAISSPLRQLALALKGMAEGDCSVALRRSGIAEIAAINASVADAQADQEVRDRLTGEITAVISACAAGDFTRRLDTGSANGTFAELGRGVNAIGEAAEGGLDALAAGDLTRRMPEGQQGIFLEISRSVDGLADSLRSMVEQISSSSSALNGASSEIATAAEDASRRIESSAAALEQTSAAVQVLNDNVREPAGSAEQARSFVNSAKEGTTRTREVAEQTADAMQRIERSSAEIAKITDLIEDVAFQTNLLALNAGVEAARAGEAGRGFAVVASEVRALAQRSADAVQEINTLIKSSTHEVAGGVRLVKETGEALAGIQSQVEQVADRVNSIADAATDQANGLSEVSIAVQNLDTDAQKNAATLEETAAAGQMLRGEAQTLVAAVGGFKLDSSAAPAAAPVAAVPAAPPEDDGWQSFDEGPEMPLAHSA